MRELIIKRMEETEFVFSDLQKRYSKLGTKFWKVDDDKLININEV